ncbi:hypothetical protein ACR79N_02325 [Sphingobacterium siyangense]|uniref:hypothetical protein n=1 Tax=Sphingobacterium siyangense TaxID=459529 RepID=UPI003DA3DFF8
MKALEDLVSPLARRLNSSIVSSFIISWTVINYEFFLTLIFSSQPIKERIVEAEGYVSNIGTSWMLPLLFTLLYVLVLPIIDSFVALLNSGAIIRSNRNNSNIRRAELLNEIINATEEKRLNDIKSGYAEVQTLNQENASLRALLEQKNTIIEENTKALEQIKAETDSVISNLQNDYGHMQGLYRDTSHELSQLKKSLDKGMGI